MMTKKDIEQRFRKVYICGIKYRAPQGSEKIGYNSGLLGWNWDAYEKDGTAYIVGFRNFPRGIEL